MHSETRTLRIPLRGSAEALQLFGPQDLFLRAIQAETAAKIISRGDEILLQGENSAVEAVGRLLNTLLDLVRQGVDLGIHDVIYAQHLVARGREAELVPLFAEDLRIAVGEKQLIRARTLGQLRYLRAVERKDIVFGIGPAGTGKTFLAVALAVAAHKARRVRRIVLTRPAVEAGERLGFLPGDLQEKVDPYLRPLYDGLHGLLGAETVARMLERGTIEIAPLAYMRGRTLEDAFIILDEAQNTTPAQMKMFLTRLGMGSKMVITGDVTQIDLPHGQPSGLQEVQEILAGIAGVSFILFGAEDVVRHALVQRIVSAYEASAVQKFSRP